MPIIYNSTPIARIDSNFSNQMTELKKTNKDIYNGTMGNDIRTWQMPNPTSKEGSWDYDLFNITGIKLPFSRKDPNKLYIRALLKGAPVGVDAQEAKIPIGEGRIADCMVEQIQIEYLSSLERAFRMRHASSIRCAFHSAARRKGHSSLVDSGNETNKDSLGPRGGIFTNIIKHLLLLIDAGYNGAPVPIQQPSVSVAYDNSENSVSVVA